VSSEAFGSVGTSPLGATRAKGAGWRRGAARAGADAALGVLRRQPQQHRRLNKGLKRGNGPEVLGLE
jgi:hypothetical protein